MCHEVRILNLSSNVRGEVIIMDASESRKGVAENIDIVIVNV
jgi:hypothetical protein